MVVMLSTVYCCNKEEQGNTSLRQSTQTEPELHCPSLNHGGTCQPSMLSVTKLAYSLEKVDLKK